MPRDRFGRRVYAFHVCRSCDKTLGGVAGWASTKRQRKTQPVSLGPPVGWALRSGGQAPEADALSTELQARGLRSYPLSVARPSASGSSVNQGAQAEHGSVATTLVERKTPRGSSRALFQGLGHPVSAGRSSPRARRPVARLAIDTGQHEDTGVPAGRVARLVEADDAGPPMCCSAAAPIDARVGRHSSARHRWSAASDHPWRCSVCSSIQVSPGCESFLRAWL
jgi:hypothetical protein